MTSINFKKCLDGAEKIMRVAVVALMAIAGCLLAGNSFASVVTDDFTQAIDTNTWSVQSYNGYPCLTAGTATNNTSSTSAIPGCNYTTPDAIGAGALRLTPASGNQHSAIVSTAPFESSQGLQVTFTTYSWGGSRDGLASIGADGISFFLLDQSVGTTLGPNKITNLGAFGGSLAYSCANNKNPANGLTGGYLGLGMDEYGNFLNGASLDTSAIPVVTAAHDNTASGIPVQYTVGSANGWNNFYSAPYMQANRIGLRGAGNVSWYWLNANYPNLYPSSLSSGTQNAAVISTCETGTLWDYAGATTQPMLIAPTLSGALGSQTMTVTMNGLTAYNNGDSVSFTGLTVVPVTAPITSASVSGTTLSVNLSSSNIGNFPAGTTNVSVTGLTASGPATSVSAATISGTTLTTTLSSVSGYATGQTVKFTGITATNNAAQSLTPSPLSGTTATMTVASTSGYKAGDSITVSNLYGVSNTLNTVSGLTCNTLAKTISFTGGSSSVTNVEITGLPVGGAVATATNGALTPVTYSAGTLTFSAPALTALNCPTGGSPKWQQVTAMTTNGKIGTVPTSTTFTTTITSSVTGISISNLGGPTVKDTTIGVTALAGPYTITGVNTVSNTISVTLAAGNIGIPALSGATAVNSQSLAGTYTIATNAGNTFTVPVAASWPGGSTVAVATSPAATAALPAATLSGNFTISNVTSTTNTSFTVPIVGAAASITSSSGAVTDHTQSGTTNTGKIQIGNGPQLYDYAVIPNGYWVLPSTQLLAKESATSRASAVPVTYKLILTPAGSLTFLYSYNGGAYTTVLNNQSISASNGPVPKNLLFGFAGSTGGSNNNHDITCFLAEPIQSASGAGANTVQAGQVRTGTQVYTASYDPNFWTGSVKSQAIVTTTVSGVPVVAIADDATWDGACTLTGGDCGSMHVDQPLVPSPITQIAPTARTLLTWNGSTGVGLEWGSLTTAQQGTLNSSDSLGQYRLNFLRGDRSQEQTASPPGVLRGRAGVLGDVVDSSPTWIGPPSQNIGATLVDQLYSKTGSESSYATFATNVGQRLNVVYAGANDGLMHGFRTGSNDSSGNYVSTNNDGVEVLGFMPSSVLANASVVNFTSSTYGHSYFADATPGFGDLYYAGNWHTWLVSGLGPGGSEVFALDVTDPTGAYGGTAFSESNASSLVMGDWTPASLTAQGCVYATANCGNNLGNTYGTPLIRRMHNGQWAVIFGNGLGSANQHGGVFIGLINANNGQIATWYWLDTGAGSSTKNNGINYVSSADIDGDHVADYLYAGDLLGNVWRFDVTSSNPSDWAVSTYGQSGPTPLFTTGTSTNVQPITTRIVPTITYSGLAQRLVLGFGTGQGIPFTATQAEQYASGSPQTIYGIWDWDMTAWNGGQTASSGTKIPASTVTLASLSRSSSHSFTRSSLYPTAVAQTTGATRTVAMSAVCWTGSAVCGSSASSNTQYGWYFDLPATGEQVIYNPVFQGGALFVNTTIPAGTQVIGQCTPSTSTGWSMALDIGSGGGFNQNIFPDVTGSYLVATGAASVVGTKLNGVGSPYMVSVGSQQYVVNQTSTGTASITQINARGGVTVKRINWAQIR